MIAAMPEPFTWPMAWNASERSSEHDTHVARLCAEAAITSGDDLDPGAIQKY